MKADVSPAHVLVPDSAIMAAECAQVISTDAGSVHAHPKNDHGEEGLSAPDVDRWVFALRQHCPGVPIGIMTGAWAMPDVSARLDEIDAWQELPDFASVNWQEDGADEVAAKLLEQGIGIEQESDTSKVCAHGPILQCALDV